MNKDRLATNLNLAYKTFDSIIIDRRYEIGSSYISWKNYQSGIAKSAYAIEYVKLLSDNQYSILMEDNSFFQFFYDFSPTQVLKKASLKFYPYPALLKLHQDDLIDALQRHDQMYDDSTDAILDACSNGAVESSNSSHFRLDYDSKVTSHSKCHFQFSGMNDLRLNSDSIPTPLTFMDFIINQYYPNSKHRNEAFESSLAANIELHFPIANDEDFTFESTYKKKNRKPKSAENAVQKIITQVKSLGSKPSKKN